PRPPNAWIIYRSDKLKELGKPKSGQPKVPQAEISKSISLMWRNETEDVKKKYERMAEYAKAEHARMYPNYRFAPMKKADK
ncbi:high mobility group box, partial [Peniophora sp. CONT]